MGEFTIEGVTAADVPAILDIYRPSITDSAVSFETEVPTVEAMAQRVARVSADYPYLVARDESSAAVLGYAYGTRFRERAAYQWGAEVSVYVADAARRRGVARALYARLFSELEARGFARLYAGITLPNDPSVLLHEALGFTAVGVFRGAGFKFGKWHDVGFWELALASPAAPEPPEFGAFRA